MDSAVAMIESSDGGDSTAAQGMPQRASAGLPTKKDGREGDPGHAFCLREEIFRDYHVRVARS
jgi:hypothetical protein